MTDVATRLNEREYRSLVEHSPVLIWRSGLDAGCDYFNDTWLQFTGRSFEQEFGNGWAEGVHADDLARCVDYYLDHFRRQAPFEMEYRLRRHDGVYRWILDRGTPVFDAGGVFAGFIGSCIDVEARHRAQEDRAFAVAQEFERWILGIVAHDIRNPLDAINHAAELIRLKAVDPVAVERGVERIRRAVDRIKHLVDDLFDVTRERQGGVPLARANADLVSICRAVIEELQGAADGRVSFSHEGDAQGAWDRHRVEQCVSNLITNALTHSPAGTPVTVSARGADTEVVIEIRNDGLIPPDIMTTLFVPFKPLREHGGHSSGLGLGLFISDAIARAHGGRIEVKSTDQGETSFSLVLPRQVPATAADGLSTPRR